MELCRTDAAPPQGLISSPSASDGQTAHCEVAITRPIERAQPPAACGCARPFKLTDLTPYYAEMQRRRRITAIAPITASPVVAGSGMMFMSRNILAVWDSPGCKAT